MPEFIMEQLENQSVNQLIQTPGLISSYCHSIRTRSVTYDFFIILGIKIGLIHSKQEKNASIVDLFTTSCFSFQVYSG